MTRLPFLPYLRKRLPQMLETLRELTLLESPSLEKDPTDRCCEFLAERWLHHGTIAQIMRQKHRGDHLRVVWKPSEDRAKSQLLVLGHYDTVYPIGTLAKMPFRISAGKAYGPGTFDMKAGIVQALFALEAIRELRAPVQKRLVFLWTSDEEIGSESSRKLIEEEAARSDAVFVLEPSLGPRGLLKTSRKGVGEAELIVHGRASHAGLAPEKGINAVHELAAQIGRLEKWNDLRRGVTINADIVSGGSRANVIADHAHATLDLRAWHQADMRALEKRLHSLKPVHHGAKLEIRGGFDRPPLERKHSAALFARAKAIARKLGFPLGEAAAGGGSDGNFTAALGIPTLDGLGAGGGRPPPTPPPPRHPPPRRPRRRRRRRPRHSRARPHPHHAPARGPPRGSAGRLIALRRNHSVAHPFRGEAFHRASKLEMWKGKPSGLDGPSSKPKKPYLP